MDSLNSKILEKTVISGGYCVGCGACAVPTESPYQIKFSIDKYLPVVCDDQKTDIFVNAVCPFSDSSINEDDLARQLFLSKTLHHDPRVGNYLRIGAMWVNDTKDRLLSSSGGITTWVTQHLLQEKIVDGVIHVRPRNTSVSDRRLFHYAISKTVDEIQAGCSSRYYPVSMDEVIRQVLVDSQRYVFVGLPCFVKALRLLMINNPKLSVLIPYTIGLVCGHLKTAGFAELLASQCGVAPSDLKEINFRTKLPDFPANKYGVQFSYNSSHGIKKITVPNFRLLGSNWGHSFFKQKGCDFCDDVFAETADLVIGDAWLPQYKKDWHGTSLVVTRNKELDDCLSKGIAVGQLSFNPLPVSESISSQRANFAHRRDALPYRLSQIDKMGLWRPKKRFETTAIHMSKKRAEVVDLRGKLAQLTQDVWRRVRDNKPIKEAFDIFRCEVQPIVDELEFKAFGQFAEAGHIPQKAKEKLIKSLSGILRQSRRPNLGWMFGSLRKGRVMVLPPASPGSFGDEAVLEATTNHLKYLGRDQFIFMSYNSTDNWSIHQSNITSFSVSNYLAYRSLKTAMTILFNCLFVERLVICGTDVLDGHHNLSRSLGRLAVAELVADAGLPVTIIGSSFSENAEPAARHKLRHTKGKITICTRDPISFDVVNNILHQGVRLVADPAFLLPAVRAERVKIALTPWIEKQHGNGGVILGFNANHFLAQGNDGRDGELLIESFSEVLLNLAKAHPELGICLIPHDIRGNPSDVDLAKGILKRISPELGTRCVMTPEGLSASEIKDVVSQLDVIFSGKMHLSIAAFGSCVPVGCITYKDKKFLGLFNHFGLEDWLLPENAWRNQDLLLVLLTKLIEQRTEIKQLITAKLPYIKDLAKQNFMDFAG